MRVLIITSVPAETEAIGPLDQTTIITGGIGRTNAAAATTEGIIAHGPLDAVLSAGVAGALPGCGLSIGDVVVADRCVYAEEGLVTSAGFTDMEGMGLSLGDFPGNAVPVDEGLLGRLRRQFFTATIATVATCSGTDAAAAEVVHRTGAVAEAMEGAAVVHAARRLGVPAIEVRVVSNTCGERDRQKWNLPEALDALHRAMPRAMAALHLA